MILIIFYFFSKRNKMIFIFHQMEIIILIHLINLVEKLINLYEVEIELITIILQINYWNYIFIAFLYFYNY